MEAIGTLTPESYSFARSLVPLSGKNPLANKSDVQFERRGTPIGVRMGSDVHVDEIHYNP